MLKDYYDYLLQDNGLVELRYMNGGFINSEIYDCREDLEAGLLYAEKKGNIYTSLNKPNETVNRDSALKNADFVRHTRIVFDLDPTRWKMAGIDCCSTDHEHSAAHKMAIKLHSFLSAFGWPQALMASSGNGWHLQYRVALPATEETKRQLSLIYAGLKPLFSDDDVSFDTTVKNIGRIFRAYGSVNRKGANTQVRPHRESRCVMPQVWEQVPANLVEALANKFEADNLPEKVTGKCTVKEHGDFTGGHGDYSTLNVVAWFKSHGLYESHIEGNKHSVCCPWEHEHSSSTGGDSIIFEVRGDGWAGFHCKHDHCEGRDIRDVIAKYQDADSFCARKWTPQNDNA